jgi:hypothetical protein
MGKLLLSGIPLDLTGVFYHQPLQRLFRLVFWSLARFLQQQLVQKKEEKLLGREQFGVFSAMTCPLSFFLASPWKKIHPCTEKLFSPPAA